MAAAGEAIRSLVAGPVRPARVVHAGPHATYFAVTGPGAAASEVFALLGPGAVRVPIGILLDAPQPPSCSGMQIGDGAVSVGGRRQPILRWWATRVPHHGRREPRVAIGEPDLPSTVDERLGRGEGLTPEGDDELAGMLVALHAYGRRAEAHGLAVAVLARLDVRPNVATAVSAALLRAACHGHAVPQLARFLADDCATGTPAHRDLLAVGHTSGSALARGALWVHRRHTHIQEAAHV